MGISCFPDVVSKMDEVKKKILFYTSSLDRGGMERVFVNLAHYFLSQKFDVVMVTQYRHENEYFLEPEIPRVLSDLTSEELSESRIKNFIGRLKKLRSIFKQYEPDLVLTCNGKNNMMALAAAGGLKCCVVLSVIADPMMEYYTKAMRFIARTFFQRADGIVVQTEEVKKFFPERIRKKCKLLPNSLNPEFIMEKYQGDKEKKIVSVGRLDANKNQAMLIRAFGQIADKHPEYQVSLYGEGEERNALEALIRENHLENRVILEGRVSDVPERIRKAELFVLTSFTEGMPNALIEAMALGLTVVSTDCPSGGPRQLIKNGENGILIPPGDEQALTKALDQLLADKEYRERLSQNAYKLQTELNPEHVNAMWRDYFEELIKRKQGS